jgi:hypothetical protein
MSQPAGMLIDRTLEGSRQACRQVQVSPIAQFQRNARCGHFALGTVVRISVWKAIATLFSASLSASVMWSFVIKGVKLSGC